MSTEALGLVSLGSYLVNFYFIVSISINSMSNRFISIEILNENYIDASNYFSAVYLLNILLSFIIIILSSVFIPFINNIFNISDFIIADFQIYLIFLNINFIILLFSSLYSVSYFVSNNLYLENYRKMESLIIKSLLLFGLYFFLKANIYFVSLAILISSMYLFWSSRDYFNSNLKDIEISLRVEYKHIKELLNSGFHNSVIRLSQVILDGFDLILANFFLTNLLMGEIALSKIILTALLSLISVVSASYLPTITRSYSLNNKEDLLITIVSALNKQIRLTTIPIAIFTVFGMEFIELWIPKENSSSVYLITIASLFPIYLVAPYNSLYDLFTIRNQVSKISKIMFFSSISSFLLVLLFCYLFGSNPYFIVSISAFLGLFRTLFYTIPHYSNYFNVSRLYFWKFALKNLVFVLITVIFSLFIKSSFLFVLNWFSLIFCISICSIISLMFNSFFIKQFSDYYVDKCNNSSL